MQNKHLQDKSVLGLFSQYLQDKLGKITIGKSSNIFSSLSNRFKLWRFKSQLADLNRKLQLGKDDPKVVQDLLINKFLPLILKFSTHQEEPFKSFGKDLGLMLADVLLRLDSISYVKLNELLKDKIDATSLNSLIAAKVKIEQNKQNQIQFQKNLKELIEGSYSKDLNEALDHIIEIKNVFLLKKTEYVNNIAKLKEEIIKAQGLLGNCCAPIQNLKNRIQDLSHEEQHAKYLIGYEKQHWSEPTCYDMGYMYRNCNCKHSGYNEVPIYEVDYGRRQQARKELPPLRKELKQLQQELQPTIESLSKEIEESKTFLDKLKLKLQKVVHYISQLENLPILKNRWEGNDLDQMYQQVREKNLAHLIPLYLDLPEDKRIHLLKYIIKMTPEPKFLCDFNALLIEKAKENNVILTLLGNEDISHGEKHYYVLALAIESKDTVLPHVLSSALGLNYGSSIDKEEALIIDMIKRSFGNPLIRRRLQTGFQAAKDLPKGSSQEDRLKAFWKNADFRYYNQKYTSNNVPQKQEKLSDRNGKQEFEQSCLTKSM